MSERETCNNCGTPLGFCPDCTAPACLADICGGPDGVCLAEPTSCAGSRLRHESRELNTNLARFLADPIKVGIAYLPDVLRFGARRVHKLALQAESERAERQVRAGEGVSG